MDFLEEYFEGKAITYDQLAQKMKSDDKVKVANLANGDYVSVEKYKALVAQQSELKKELAAAQGELESKNEVDVESLKAQADEYKLQAEQVRKEAEEELKSLSYAMAVQESCAELDFSSASAKRAFMDELQKENLPLENGIITGFEEFLENWRQKDPKAFAEESIAPRLVAPSEPLASASGWREKIGLNYQSAKLEEFE